MKSTLLIIIWLLAAFTLASPGHCAGAAYLVVNSNDSGAGSLRQAIVDNNASGGGTITFSNTVTGTIALTSGELAVSNDVTILGPGSAVLAVDGGGASRVFRIQFGNASIADVTIANGYSAGMPGAPGLQGLTARGGGIFIRQTSSLALTRCVVRNNTIVGGPGGPAPSDPGVSGNGGGGLGGGIGNAGTLMLTDCMVANNTALGGPGGAIGLLGTPGVGGVGWGGGLYSAGSATLMRCTISSNSVTAGTDFNNGVTGVGAGGGIYNTTNMSLVNCTVAYNLATSSAADAGGGIYQSGTGGLTNRSCTIARNQASTGGGLYINGSAPDLGNTIVANQATFSAPDCSGTIYSSDYNLIGDTTGCTINGTTTHNILGLPPKLGLLQDNGGPTLTIALRANSPAIDAGSSFGLSTDQRGAPRPFDYPAIPNADAGDGSDIGAFEVGSPQLTVQAVGNDAVLSWPSYYGNFFVEANTDLTSSNNWAPVFSSPVLSGSQYWSTNGPILGNVFFRLYSN